MYQTNTCRQWQSARQYRCIYTTKIYKHHTFRFQIHITWYSTTRTAYTAILDTSRNLVKSISISYITLEMPCGFTDVRFVVFSFSENDSLLFRDYLYVVVDSSLCCYGHFLTNHREMIYSLVGAVWYAIINNAVSMRRNCVKKIIWMGNIFDSNEKSIRFHLSYVRHSMPVHIFALPWYWF